MSPAGALKRIKEMGVAAAVILAVTAGMPAFAFQSAATDCDELSLYCIRLYSTDRVPDALGHALLTRPETPFGAAVTRDGRQRYEIEVFIAGLPEPSHLGPYTSYVLWATTPELHPMENLGALGNGRTVLGEISLNKFLLLVSAEADPKATARNGPLVLRGQSASSRMEAHGALQVASIGIAMGSLEDDLAREDGDAAAAPPAMHEHGVSAISWTMPPMHPLVPMMPGMSHLAPAGEPWVLAADPGSGVPDARPRQVIRLSDGDSLLLRAGPVRKTVGGRNFLMYGYNDQIPGPIIEVGQASTIVVDFVNDTAIPSSIHWHGLRHDNRFDGVPGLTQDAVAPGETFRYFVHFPDAGLYWYHPHHREDIQQDLGLAGNLLVRPTDANYLPPVDREEVLVLDDFLIDEAGVVPFGSVSANYMLMGRFGNRLLINGDTRYDVTVKAGDIVRFYLTNVSNTRTWNLSIDGHAMKVQASDIGRFEREMWAESAAIAPAERYIADIRFEEAGLFPIVNRVQALNHQLGRFFPEVDTLGFVRVTADAEDDLPALAGEFEQAGAGEFAETLARADVTNEIDPYRRYVDSEPDRVFELTLEADSLPPVIRQFMRLEQIYFNPVEWSGTMPMMNWATTGREIEWIIRDAKSGAENREIEWRVRRGTVEKVRIVNRRDAIHAMQHPIHLHGQRFLVVAYNGKPVKNLAWKDTVLIPAGMTADLILDYTNPGKWMMHCHIAEHLESGMKLVFEVTE